MEQKPSTKANSFSASQDNPPVHNSWPLVSILTQSNTEHSIKSSCLKMHLNITLSSKLYLTFIFSHQKPLRSFTFTHKNATLDYTLLFSTVNPLNAELNPICYLLALLEVHHFLHVSRIRVKSLTVRLLMSYIYMEHPFLMFLDHTQRRTTVGRTPLDE